MKEHGYSWRIRRLLLLTATVLPLAFATGSAAGCGDDVTGPCCKVCTTGKACGDSCISRDKTCQVGSGCACNG